MQMGSSEIVDSGKVAGQKSQFSQTCNLLSQFLKTQGSFGDLNNLGIYRSFDPSTGNQTATTTMNLLPMIEKSGDNNPQKAMNLFPQQIYSKSDQPEKSQMTIFYGGQVIVFDDFPADKASEIMKLANKKSNNTFSYGMVNNNKNNIPKSSETCNNIVTSFGNTWTKELPISDLPIARRNSLSRFLEKRRDRITATAPYQLSKKNLSVPSKVEENNSATWLGLGAQFVPVKTEQYF